MTVAQMSAFISFPAGEPDPCREKMRGLIIGERERECYYLFKEGEQNIYIFRKGKYTHRKHLQDLNV